MTVQQPKRRPLSRYLKDFKHSQTHCAHCHKLLDRITLVRRGKIVNKIAISQLDMLLDDAAWQREQKEWVALCRFCGDLHCKKQSDFFDIIGFKQYLFEQTEMSHGADRKAGLETLFFEPEGEGFSLPPDSPALHVIQHIRDESHDHAIGGHRKKRAKVKNTSTLETIEGVGPKRRQMLLKYMGGLQGLRNASVEEIAKVPGISQGLAEKIFWSLKH
ncbi:flagella biosynthesis regulatory protein FliZ [Salmonella enterica]|nr:flagella biosynthesis regulatory protein FliZ [Salmonella enterica]